MNSYISILILFLTFSLCSCRSEESPINPTPSTSNSRSSLKPDSATAAVNPLARIENGKTYTFAEFTFALPSDWEKIVSSDSTFLCKTPTIESQFGNCIITKDFAVNEYTSLDAEAAVTRLKAKKEAAGGAAKVQLLAIDNVTGVLEEKEFKDSTKPETAEVWTWETFMRSKEKKYMVRIGFTYPSNAKEKYKPVVDGIVNSIKIRRSPDLKIAEFKPQ
jgi:hypothetical protein